MHNISQVTEILTTIALAISMPIAIAMQLATTITMALSRTIGAVKGTDIYW